MSWSAESQRDINRLQRVQHELAQAYVGRGVAARLLVLAAVSGEHVLLLGPPGTAKSDMITRFCGLIGATPFTYLLTRFTEPSEIFGPLDFERFTAGEYRVRTEGMLPQAEIAFLDEVFQGSSAILNTLLALLNERIYHNGPVREPAPLVTLLGASSELPDDPALAAFSDRFLLRAKIEPVAGNRLTDLVDLGWEYERERLAGTDAKVHAVITMPAVRALGRQVRLVDTELVKAPYTGIVSELLTQGVTLSDRRVVRGMKLVAAAALLRGADVAESRDLWPLAHLWTDQGDIPAVTQTVRDRIEDDGDPDIQVRSPAVLLQLAQHRAGQVLGERRVIASSVVATLRMLNTIGNELRRDHPGATTELTEVRQYIDQVAVLLDGGR